MTDNTPTFDAEAWLAKERDHTARAASVRPQNKTVLFDALARHGITTVTVEFDGYGDSGQIEDIAVTAGDQPAALPDETIPLARAEWDVPGIVHVTHSVREAIETLVYDLLQQTHAGWENSDGAYGDITFDVTERTITLDYNERHMESDYSQHVF